MVSNKILCDLEGHFDLKGQWQGKCIFFFIAWFIRSKLRQFLTEYLQIIKCGHWEWNFRFSRYHVIIIFKLEYIRYLLSDRCQICFSKRRKMMTFIWQNTFYVNCGLPNMTSFSFQLRISLLLCVGLSHTLVREIWIVHITLRCVKYNVSLTVTLTFWVNCNVNEYSLCLLISPFITPSILDRITSNFERWLLKKELPVAWVLCHQYL